MGEMDGWTALLCTVHAAFLAVVPLLSAVKITPSCVPCCVIKTIWQMLGICADVSLVRICQMHEPQLQQ